MEKKYLKAVSLSHLDEETRLQIREWRNSDFVRKNMFTQHEITVEEHLKYLRKIEQDPNRDVIVFYLDDKPFGVYQYEIENPGKYLTSGSYLVSEEYSDEGFGVILAYFINYINYEKLDIFKAYAEVIGKNKKAQGLNKRFGHLEGILQKQKYLNGEYVDIYCYGGFREDWEKAKSKYSKIIDHFVNGYEIVL